MYVSFPYADFLFIIRKKQESLFLSLFTCALSNHIFTLRVSLGFPDTNHPVTRARDELLTALLRQSYTALTSFLT